MNHTGYVALVDTDRAELREHIATAWKHFDRVARSADPMARPPRMEWTALQIVAHVLTVAYRYREIMDGRMFRRAGSPRDVDVINQIELDAIMAPQPDMIEQLDQLRAIAADMDAFFDTITDESVFPFHCDIEISGVAAQTNWLGELVFHGEDIARAASAPFDIRERDMLLIARGLMEMGHAWVRSDLSPDTDLCVALKVPDARPYVIHIHHGTAEFRERRSDDRPDAVMRTPASVLTQMLYQRIGPIGAARRGLFIVGGRRPWAALKLQSYFEGA
jgi:hypothetical protein